MCRIRHAGEDFSRQKTRIMTKKPKSRPELPPFIPIYSEELDEHLRLGKMSLKDTGVYLLLNRRCNWRSGIYFGCAATITALFGSRAKKPEVQRSLSNLRRVGIINYRLGKGFRGSYNILIHGFLPRVGERMGYRLNAFAPNSLDQPVYERANGQGTLDGLSTNGERTIGEPLQEYKRKRREEIKNQKVGRSVGRMAQPAAAVPSAAHLSVRQDQTQIDSVATECEYTTLVEPECRAEAGADHDAEPVLCAGSDAVAWLTSRFFEFQGKPARFQAELPAWAERFQKLLQAYGDYLPEMVEYAFTQDSFWPQKLIRSDDPMGYLEQKLSEGIIPEKFRQWKALMKNRKNQVQPKVASNGQQQQYSRAGIRVAGKQQVDNRAAAEEAKRWIEESLGIES